MMHSHKLNPQLAKAKQLPVHKAKRMAVLPKLRYQEHIVPLERSAPALQLLTATAQLMPK